MKGDFRIVPPDDTNQVKPSPQGVIIWRVINAIMTIFFLLAAYVNMNDSDWYIWVPIYTVPGLLSLVSCVRPDAPNSAVWSYCAVSFLGLCIALVIYIIVSAVELKGANNPLQFEEGREMSGVLIMMTWIGISRFTNIGRPGSSVNNKMLRNSMLLMACLLAVSPVIIWSLCLHESGKGYFSHCTSMIQGVQAKQEF